MEMGANAGARYSILYFQSSSSRMKSFSKETAKLHNQKGGCMHRFYSDTGSLFSLFSSYFLNESNIIFSYSY